jgi:hypothetical protein
MNPYNPEEILKINKLKDINDKLEEYFTSKRDNWGSLVGPLFESLKLEINLETSKRIMETQSYSLSYRQNINGEISTFLDKRSRQEVKLKKLRQEKFIFYATGFGVKTNMGEKSILIDAHVAEEQRNIEIVENYIEFLRQLNKNLESLQYTLKNIIELFNLLK